MIKPADFDNGNSIKELTVTKLAIISIIWRKQIHLSPNNLPSSKKKKKMRQIIIIILSYFYESGTAWLQAS